MNDIIKLAHGHSWGGSYMSLSVVDKLGIQHLVKGLESFEQNKAITDGLIKGANIFKSKGRSNLRRRISKKSTGNLMGAFRTYSTPKLLKAKAGFTEKGNHAHLVDLGTVKRLTKRTRANRGIMPANNFWNDARQSEEKKALDAVLQGIQKAVQRINDRR